jgi:hypothetical protein
LFAIYLGIHLKPQLNLNILNKSSISGKGQGAF